MKRKNPNTTTLLLLAGAGAAYYFLIHKKKEEEIKKKKEDLKMKDLKDDYSGPFEQDFHLGKLSRNALTTLGREYIAVSGLGGAQVAVAVGLYGAAQERLGVADDHNQQIINAPAGRVCAEDGSDDTGIWSVYSVGELARKADTRITRASATGCTRSLGTPLADSSLVHGSAPCTS